MRIWVVGVLECCPEWAFSSEDAARAFIEGKYAEFAGDEAYLKSEGVEGVDHIPREHWYIKELDLAP